MAAVMGYEEAVADAYCPCHGEPWYVRRGKKAGERECFVKESVRKSAYDASAEGRAARKAYRVSAEGRAIERRREDSPRRKAYKMDYTIRRKIERRLTA